MRRFIHFILCTAALVLECAFHYHLGIMADEGNMTSAVILGGEAWNTVSWLLLLCLLILEVSLFISLVSKGKKA